MAPMPAKECDRRRHCRSVEPSVLASRPAVKTVNSSQQFHQLAQQPALPVRFSDHPMTTTTHAVDDNALALITCIPGRGTTANSAAKQTTNDGSFDPLLGCSEQRA